MIKITKKFLKSLYFLMKESSTYYIPLYTQCNHKCRMCTAAEFNGLEKNMPLAEIKKEIIKGKSLGATEILIGGTEATLYPYLVKIIDFISINGMRCWFGTNGHRFASLAYTNHFKKLNSFTVKITFHSHKQEIFDYLSDTPGSYFYALKAIKNILSRLKVFPESKSKWLFVNIVISRYNYKDLPAMISFLYRLGVRCVCISYLTLTGRAYENPDLLIDLDSLKPFLTKTISLMGKLKMVYILSKLPICIQESKFDYFLPPFDKSIGIKESKCKECSFDRKCWGISKVHFIAKYKNEALKYNFLNQKDVELIKQYEF